MREFAKDFSEQAGIPTQICLAGIGLQAGFYILILEPILILSPSLKTFMYVDSFPRYPDASTNTCSFLVFQIFKINFYWSIIDIQYCVSF